MTQTPPGSDPVHDALDELVRSGVIDGQQAQAAYDASRGRAHGAGTTTPPDGSSRAIAFPRVGRSAGPLQLDTLLVALGAALVSATVVLSALYSRGGLALDASMQPGAGHQDNDLDWSNFSLGIVATLGLLGVAVAAWFLVRDPDRRLNLFAWPGALGALGAGVMLGVAMDDADATPYAVGALVLALSAVGFWLSRRAPFVLTAIVGLGFLYTKLFGDAVDPDGDGDNLMMIIAFAVFVFAIAVTVAGWFFPTRDLSSIVVGGIAGYGLGLLLLAISVMRLIQGIFGDLSVQLDEAGGDTPKPKAETPFDNDVWVILVLAALLIAVWAACWWVTGHVGYRVLILATVTSVVPSATLALASEHPSWWGLAVGVVGGAVLVLVGLRSLGRVGAEAR
ncbi:hypothetical protein ASG90_15905 [Nocardioides sp. Soil797]|nr:hypothetical protein ASG90_15905 [Nocardioides sp. Soil797]